MEAPLSYSSFPDSCVASHAGRIHFLGPREATLLPKWPDLIKPCLGVSFGNGCGGKIKRQKRQREGGVQQIQTQRAIARKEIVKEELR